MYVSFVTASICINPFIANKIKLDFNPISKAFVDFDIFDNVYML